MVRPRPPNPWPDTQRTPRRDELLSPRTQIVADPEAFGNMSFGSANASEIDRKVTIFYAR